MPWAERGVCRQPAPPRRRVSTALTRVVAQQTVEQRPAVREAPGGLSAPSRPGFIELIRRYQDDLERIGHAAQAKLDKPDPRPVPEQIVELGSAIANCA